MKALKITLLFLVILSFASCKVTEDIYINEDGSGKFLVNLDASDMMEMTPKDSLATDVGKQVDSTFTFQKFFEDNKDSIAKLSPREKERIEKLKRFSVNMKVNSAENVFKFSMFTDFKTVVDLQDGITSLNDLNRLNRGKTELSILDMGSFDANKTIVRYSYVGKKFTRKAQILDFIKTKPVDTINDSSFKMITEASVYILKYHFPRKVKKVSNSTAKFSEDRKTITIEFPLNEYIENPKKLDLDVEFE
ncbi:MAG: hypothetical protein O9267_10850 [Flavobacterium sp.]|uniref:hypothetical protein n=1 Tax=Flavobacterium sp. TaxID=239 RepID=UPI0022BCEDD1|nr:hypothetical protein [Flavobacterium sp.]MCZ8198096.1 hypothetical protein [Flavobacterium sp.]